MIYFVRHGQTPDNIANVLTGWTATPLTEKGIEQAKATAETLKNVKFDICFCSPLVRTKQTLDEIIKYHKNLPVIYDDRLKERNYGLATGKSVDICNFKRWSAEDNNSIPLEIETINQMFDRVSAFYNEILTKYKDQNVLIVSHSGVARISHFYFNGKPANSDYSNFKIGNAEILMLDNSKPTNI